MPKTLIKNARIVNESSIFESDILVEDQYIIGKIASSISDDTAKVIDLQGQLLYYPDVLTIRFIFANQD